MVYRGCSPPPGFLSKRLSFSSTTSTDQSSLHPSSETDEAEFNRRTSDRVPPPPVVLRRPEATQIVSNPPLASSESKCAAPRAVHVVSGLAKGKDMPVPEENRTMAKGDFGDDAAFFVETTSKYVLGISDGAGGNRGYGFDPRRFARQLMRHCAGYVLEQSKDDVADLDPVQTVFTALQMCQDRKIYGSGTVCLCSLEKCNGRLDTINIGDSGYLIIRDGRILTGAKRHYRDDGSEAPLQLDVYPWSFEQRAKFMLESGEIGNVDLLRDSVQTQPGDLLLMASDGVFDSVSQEQILSIIWHGLLSIIDIRQPDWSSLKQMLIATADSIVAATKSMRSAPDDVIVILARL